MKPIAITAFLSLQSCVSAQLEKTEPKDQKIRTIGYFTGTMADDGLYQSRFTDGASKQCPNGYDILERTRNPTTLAGMSLPESRFYWVIRCK